MRRLLFSLPKVGHGFPAPRNWEPQFVDAYRAIASAHAPHEAARGSMTGVGDVGLVEVPASSGVDRGAMAYERLAELILDPPATQ